MPHDERLSAEVNRLYWESDASVAEIADRLGISRRALYQALKSLPAGVRCPECGADLVFANRSSRSAGAATCPACALEEDIALLRGLTAEAGPALRQAADRRERGTPEQTETEPEVEQEWRAGRMAPIHADLAVRRGRLLLLGGAALAGLAVGVIIGVRGSRR